RERDPSRRAREARVRIRTSGLRYERANAFQPHSASKALDEDRVLGKLEPGGLDEGGSESRIALAKRIESIGDAHGPESARLLRVLSHLAVKVEERRRDPSRGILRSGAADASEREQVVDVVLDRRRAPKEPRDLLHGASALDLEHRDRARSLAIERCLAEGNEPREALRDRGAQAGIDRGRPGSGEAIARSGLVLPERDVPEADLEKPQRVEAIA